MLKRDGPLRYYSADGRFVALASTRTLRSKAGVAITRITGWTLFDGVTGQVRRDVPLQYVREVVNQERTQDATPADGRA